MAPDLNTVPPSPRNSRRTSTSRTSEPMAPPPAPRTSLSSQNLGENSVSAVSNPNAPTGDNTGVGIGPGADEPGFDLPLAFVVLILIRSSPSSAPPHRGRLAYATGERTGSCGRFP